MIKQLCKNCWQNVILYQIYCAQGQVLPLRDSDHFVRPRVCSANYPIIDFFWQDFVLQKIIRVRIPFLLSSKKQDIAFAMPCFLWRRARDSAHFVRPRVCSANYPIIDFFWQDFVLQKIIRVRIPFLLSNKKQDIAFAMPCFLWRRARDSNPRTVLGGYTISNRAPSTSSDNSP